MKLKVIGGWQSLIERWKLKRLQNPWPLIQLFVTSSSSPNRAIQTLASTIALAADYSNAPPFLAITMCDCWRECSIGTVAVGKRRSGDDEVTLGCSSPATCSEACAYEQCSFCSFFSNEFFIFGLCRLPFETSPFHYFRFLLFSSFNFSSVANMFSIARLCDFHWCSEIDFLPPLSSPSPFIGCTKTSTVGRRVSSLPFSIAVLISNGFQSCYCRQTDWVAADFRMHPGKSGFGGAISEDIVQL